MSTVLELNTLTTRVWPLVPGLRDSTFTNIGFRSPGFAGVPSGCCVGVVVVVVVVVVVAIDRDREREAIGEF